MGDGLIFAIAVSDCGFLLFVAVYFIVFFGCWELKIYCYVPKTIGPIDKDLECDYLNAASCCSKLNRLVLPEVIALGITLLSLLLSWHWLLFLLNLPLFSYSLYRYIHIPSGNIGMYDPTEIHNRRQLQTHMKESMAKTAYHVVFFFIYLYCLVYALVTSTSISQE